MINLLSLNQQQTYGVKEFVLDSEADIASLPKDVVPGSTAIIISTSSVYMMNSKKEWVEI